MPTETTPSSRSPFVVVGGGPAARSAAEAYRDAGGTGDVVLLTGEPDLPYERPALSKELLRGTTSPGELALVDDGWYREHAVRVRTGAPVAAVEPAAGRVLLADGTAEPYGTCLLATGAAALPLPVPGGDHPDLLRLRSLRSAVRLADRAAGARSAIVVGTGFVGCEAASSLAARGIAVTLVGGDRVPQLDRLGAEAGERIAAWLAEDGVTLVAGSPVARFEDGRRAILKDGAVHEADLVLVAAGVRPRVALAERAGAELADGAVAVDAAMRTSVPGLLAAGDVTMATNAAAGRRLHVEHWGEALAMGEVAGRTAAGADARWDQAPGFWSTIGERTLKQVAWGDGWDEARLDAGPDGAFTVWYGRAGRTVGVLTHGHDEDYERGRELVEAGRPLPRP